MIIIKTRSEVKVKVTVTRKWYATLRHPKMYPHTKFGIPNSKNIGDMDRTRKRDGRTDGRTDGLTDGQTVRLLYASQSSFGGIKTKICTRLNAVSRNKVRGQVQGHSDPIMVCDTSTSQDASTHQI